MSSEPPIYYSGYLQLDKILDAQHPESRRRGREAHDETLFIVVHQVYELWFKQILHELTSIIALFRQVPLNESRLSTIAHRLQRVITIQQHLVHQIGIIETMTPLDFLEFRDLLTPSSGFQSVQFKEIEIRLGLPRAQRLPEDRQAFQSRLHGADQDYLTQLEQEANLFQLVEGWLLRMPFLVYHSFDFWQEYGRAVQQMLDREKELIEQHPLMTAAEIDKQRVKWQATRARFDQLLAEEKDPSSATGTSLPGQRLSRRATLAALFIHLYRDMPLLHLPFRILTQLLEIDEQFTVWRQRHALMVQRMLGTKIGTGGSTGGDYLRRTAENNRVFLDLYELSTFLIPRSLLPSLPPEVERDLGFYLAGKNT